MSSAPTLKKELTSLLNKHCSENGSDTPDFILAQYLLDSLSAYDAAVSAREKWYVVGLSEDLSEVQ